MSSHFITTHDSSGEAVILTKMPTEAHQLPLPSGGATLQVLYSSHSFKPDLSTDADLDQYAHDRTHGISGICPPNGTVAAIITFNAGGSSPFHRTETLDTIVILEGVVELHLDSGEMKTLKAGDSVVQRGTMHKWVNVTPNDGIVKMLATAQPTTGPIEVGGKKLGTEWLQ